MKLRAWRPPPARSARAVGNAVGYALSGKRAAARFNTAAHTIFDHHVIALARRRLPPGRRGREAIAFAGHNQLDNLILIYDSNDVTLDAMADVTQSEDAEAYFTFAKLGCRHHRRPRPNTQLPRPWKKPRRRTTAAQGHHRQDHHRQGHPGSRRHRQGPRRRRREVHRSRPRRASACPPTSTSYVSPEVRPSSLRNPPPQGRCSTPGRRPSTPGPPPTRSSPRNLTAGLDPRRPHDLSDEDPGLPADYKAATRSAAAPSSTPSPRPMPQVITGSADLYGSTKNYIKDGGDFSEEPTRLGRNIWFGIREHAMGAICNGIAYDGSSAAAPPSSSSPTTCAARASASPPWPGCPSPTSSPTTPSASVRTAPPTNRWKPSAACA
jgi:transketolase